MSLKKDIIVGNLVTLNRIEIVGTLDPGVFGDMN